MPKILEKQHKNDLKILEILEITKINTADTLLLVILMIGKTTSFFSNNIIKDTIFQTPYPQSVKLYLNLHLW